MDLKAAVRLLCNLPLRMSTTYDPQDAKFLKSLGDRIRSVRQECGLSQEELAFKAGLDRTYVGSVERGERNISVLNLERIMRALGSTAAEALRTGKP